MSYSKKSRVFIGSSSEGLDLAKALQVLLDKECEVTIWSQGVFGLSDGTLETLIAASKDYDFAALILTPDDVTISRTITNKAPRDNVLFELGLFVGSLGIHRTFIIVERESDTKLPSDLGGITRASYTVHTNGNLQATLGAVATAIQLKISTLGPLNRDNESSLAQQKQQGVRYVRYKYAFEPLFWLSVLEEADQSLEMVGHALHTWCEEPYATAFESRILKIIRSGGTVRLSVMNPTGSAHTRLRERVGRDYKNQIAETLSFIQTRVLNVLSKKEKSKLIFGFIDDIDLPYMAIRTSESILVAPYFSFSDSKKHGLMLVLDRNSQFGSGFNNDLDRLFGAVRLAF
jgi:hypothetical protein